MKFKYYGTAAYEGFPAIFCACDACKRARTAGGRNIRSRSQALIDDVLLIDFPADTAMRYLYDDLPLPDIHHCLITHKHSDHFYPKDVVARCPVYAYPETEDALHFYLPANCAPELEQLLSEQPHGDRVKLHIVKPFDTFTVADKYTVTVFPAHHSADAVFYMIDDGEHTILYAHDTGSFRDEVWEYLEKEKPHFSFVTYDCTYGNQDNGSHHMGFPVVRRMDERLKELGCVDDKTIRYVNHFSHNGKVTYDEMVPIATEYGFEVAYDGCTLEI